MDLVLSNILSGVKVDVWLSSGISHIIFLGYQIICASFTYKAFIHQKDKGVPSYIIFMMSMIVMWGIIWSGIIQVGRRPNLCRCFTSNMTQRTNFQLMKVFSLIRGIMRSRDWQELSVSLTRITKTSLLHIQSYSDGTLDWDVLGSNIFNGKFVQVVWRCK